MDLRTTNNSLTTYLKEERHVITTVLKVSRIWNTLPDKLREPDISRQKFKYFLFAGLRYYFSATTLIFLADTIKLIENWKLICLQCHEAEDS